jgi:hypothetical protein
MEAQKYLGIKSEKIIQLHIGTTFHKTTSSGRRSPRKNGLSSWREKLLDLLFSCQEQSTEQILSFILHDRYYSIDSVSDTDQNKTISLDKVSKQAQNLLVQKANEAFKIFQGKEFYEKICSHDANDFKFIPLDGGTEK